MCLLSHGDAISDREELPRDNAEGELMIIQIGWL